MNGTSRSKKIGKVSLVGAGPGDPGLLTLKALRCLEAADLIVYDTLANPEHLAHAKKDAKKVCVGKGFRHRLLTQQKINRLIIQAARRGENVVRLKGGDPYLFGRGGEEALSVGSKGIPFEVVPGVTSATGCAAYAGIPLTHREHNSSVTFLTGHKAHDEGLDSIDWKKIAALDGTLVIYMGFYNLSKIVGHLARAGMSKHTRIAIVQWGTWPRQKSCEGTLDTIERKIKGRRFGAPSIIIVGEVVRLKKDLDWFERLPLFGKRVLVTRTQERAGSLRTKLADLGAEVLEFPTIQIRPIKDFKKLDEAISNLARYQWLVFTSAYGVEAFFDRLETHHKKDARVLAPVRIACVGPETARALKERGLIYDLMPDRFETAAIVSEFQKRLRLVRDQRFLLVRTNIAPPELRQALGKLGAAVDEITGYITETPRTYSPQVKRDLLSGKLDFVTFTSSSTVAGFVRICGLKNVKKMAKNTKFVSIGPVTSKTLRSYGLTAYRQARSFTVNGLAEALAQAAAERRS